MNLAKYSPKCQAILVESQKVARARQHQAIEPEHLLRALLSDEGGKAVLERLGVKVAEIEQKLEVELTKHISAETEVGQNQNALVGLKWRWNY